MKLAEGIRKHGFRKWYERELLRGHAHLVLLLCCALGIMTAIEAAWRFRSLTDQLIDLGALLIFLVVGVWAVRRYLYLLTHAEMVANQADCPACKTYGRLELLAADDRSESVHVRCRKCAHEWRIDA